MLHFRKTSSDRSLSDMRALCCRSTMPPWLKTLSTGALEAGMANVRTWKKDLLAEPPSPSPELSSPSAAKMDLSPDSSPSPHSSNTSLIQSWVYVYEWLGEFVSYRWTLLPCGLPALHGLQVVRIDMLCFLAGCRTGQLNQVLSVLSVLYLSMFSVVFLFIRAPFMYC